MARSRWNSRAVAVRDGATGGSCAVDSAVAARRGGANAACGWGIRDSGARFALGGYCARGRHQLIGAGEAFEDCAGVVHSGAVFGLFECGEARIAPELDAGIGPDHRVATVTVIAAAVGVEMERPSATKALGDELFILGGVAADVTLQRLLGGHGCLLVARCELLMSARA
jgi:hypothetical protein